MSLLQQIRAAWGFEPTDNTCKPCVASFGAVKHVNRKGVYGFEKGELRVFDAAAESERQHQARAAAFVRKHGSITLKDIREFGCNCPSKTLHRLRRAGVVGPMCMDTWENSGRGRFKRYHAAGRFA